MSRDHPPVPQISRQLSRLLNCVAKAAAVTMLAGTQAAAQQPLPIQVNGAVLNNLASELVYTIDLETVPTRPVLHVEVTPDPAHPDMEFEIEISSWLGSFGGPGFLCMELSGNTPYVSTPAIGVNALDISLYFCEPRTLVPSFWLGDTVDVIVRPVNFGNGGAPALVDIEIQGRTQVPTGTLTTAVETNLTPATVFLYPSKDTVLYASDTEASSGLGDYLWAGQDYSLIGGPVFFTTRRDRLNSLLSFDITGNLPFNAVVSNADLRLYTYGIVGGGGSVALYETLPSVAGASWSEGNANPTGVEFTGVPSSNAAANWINRGTSSNPWTTPGGDAGTFLGSQSITTTGSHTFSSTALDNAVQNRVDSQNDQDGFMLIGPGGNFFFGDVGVRFGSGDYPIVGGRPYLRVDYAPGEPYVDGTVNTGVVSFVSEGEDFRWIYDLDQDDILVTSIGGICEVVSVQPNFLPYTYSYTGSPGYTGLDCCTWQIDSPQTGTVGTGQAIFFHNLDPLNPANMPPDTDGDGIRDNCDNCVNTPNGPALGSCVGPAGVAGTCSSDQECWSGDTCQFGQEDADGDFAGDACSVPEPGLGLGLILGSGLLAMLGRRRSRE